MRRIVLAGAAVTLAATIVPAKADPVVPRHQQSEVHSIEGVVRAVVVSGDYSDIAVSRGRSTVVRATESWNFDQPKLSVALGHGVLKVTITCDDSTSVGDTVFLGSGNLLNDCTDDLQLTVPER